MPANAILADRLEPAIFVRFPKPDRGFWSTAIRTLPSMPRGPERPLLGLTNGPLFDREGSMAAVVDRACLLMQRFVAERLLAQQVVNFDSHAGRQLGGVLRRLYVIDR